MLLCKDRPSSDPLEHVPVVILDPSADKSRRYSNVFASLLTKPEEGNFRIFLNDDNVTDKIRGHKVSLSVSNYAKKPEIRKFVFYQLRNSAHQYTTRKVANHQSHLYQTVSPKQDTEKEKIIAKQTKG